MDQRTRELWMKAVSQPEFYMSGDDALAGHYQPRVYADVPSFMEVPVAWEPEDLKGADAVFLGFPWEGGLQISGTTFAESGARPPDPDAVVSRGGAYEAPGYVRRYSIHYAIGISGGYFPELGPTFRLADHLTLMDYRDVEIKEWDVEESASRAIAKVSDIVQAGAIPLVFGGDHSTPYPIVQGISDHTRGKIGVINFDGHYDIGLGGRLDAGNAFGRIMERCQAEPENLVIIGIKGGAYNTPAMAKVAKDIGATVFTVDDVDELGMKEVVRRTIAAATRGTERVYVSLDVDSLDAVTFPAQKYPDPYGLSTKEVRWAVGVLARETNLAGFDLVCVGPAYDHKGVGALAACRFYVEVLKGLALRKARQAKA